MKKTELRRAVALCLVVALCLCGCGGQTEEKAYTLSYDENGFPRVSIAAQPQTGTQGLISAQGDSGIGMYMMGESDWPSYAETMDDVLRYHRPDSLCLVTVGRQLSMDEVRNREGYVPSVDFETMGIYYVYFEAFVVYDFLSQKEINMPLVLSVFYPVDNSLEIDAGSYPIFGTGDSFLTFLNLENARTYGKLLACMPYFYIDKGEITADSDVYSRLYSPDGLENTNLLEKDEKVRIEAYNGAKWYFTMKFRLADIVEFMKNDLEERGVTW